MHHTMELLDRALAIAPIPKWTAKLQLSRDALSNAKSKGHLSPVIAGALAAELEEDIATWTTTAALEGAPDSPAKRTLIRKLNAMRSNITSL